MEARQEMTPAATADEWLERRALDRKQAWGDILGNWYAEMPPEVEWPKLLDAMEKDLAGPGAAPEEARFPGSGGLTPGKERLFVSLMKGDEKGAQELVRELVLNGRSRASSFGREAKRDAVLALSVDPKEGVEWLEKNRAELLASGSSGSYHRSSKEAWEEALKDATLSQAITLLKADLTGDDRAEKLGRLLKVAELAEDTALRDEVVEMLWVDAQKGLKDESFRGLHSNRRLIGALAGMGDWERVKELAAELKRVKEKAEASGGYYGAGFDSMMWIAMYHVDGAESFLNELEAYLKSGEVSLQEAYVLLRDDGNTGEDLGSIYVRALLDSGRKDEAWSVVQRVLVMHPKSDPHYELARKVAPGKFVGFLDELVVFDPFEERPLIWMAEVALEAGRLDEAKDWAEKAIALDPSDGDQGKTSRMKVYDVLSRTLAKLGDEEKSRFFSEVMVSIREGEVADDFLYAGLIREATERYLAALDHFGDAYCLQSRLALTLARNGRFEEAVPHFEKAFELMPVSFGPRESHCFGCEGLFSDERVRPIAQRILAEFMKKHPDNARAPYLLGLVLESMDEKKEAMLAFRKAVELDPNYFNAATRLLNLLKEDVRNYGERRKLLARIVTIAPYSELGRFYSMRTDLAQAWREAGKVGPSPLTLGEWGFQPAPRTEQFKDDQSIYMWAPEAVKAMDGWSRDELCRENQLLKAIEDL